MAHINVHKVAIILLDRSSKIILLQGGKRESHFWLLPGGTVKNQETLEQACVRIVKDILGLTIDRQMSGGKLFRKKPTGTADMVHLVVATADYEYVEKDKADMCTVSIETALSLTNLKPAHKKLLRVEINGLR